MGTWGSFFYKPSYGTKGTVEYTLFDTGLTSADAELVLVKAHRQATSNVHGLVFSGPGAGGNLDADKLDGLHSGAFLLSGGTALSASDSDKLDGLHSGAFLLSGGTALSASDSDKLDGLHESSFVLLAGRGGGQIIYGDTAGSGTLKFHSTFDAVKGKIYFGDNSVYDELNDRLGIGITSPTQKLHLITTMTSAVETHAAYIYAESQGATLGRAVTGTIITTVTPTNAIGGSFNAYARCAGGEHAGVVGFGRADHADVTAAAGIWGADVHAISTSAVSAEPWMYGIEVGVHPGKAANANAVGIYIHNNKNWTGASNYRAGTGLLIMGSDNADAAAWDDFILCKNPAGTQMFGVDNAGRLETNGDLVIRSNTADTGYLIFGSDLNDYIQFDGTNYLFYNAGAIKARIDSSGNLVIYGDLYTGGASPLKVVGSRVIDDRCDDVVDATWGAEEAGVLDALRDAMITHGLIAAA